MEVKCTQCGGAVSIPEMEGMAACKFCGSTLYIDLQDAVGHFLIKPRLNEAGLATQLTNWLERKERYGILKITRAKEVYWPFWQARESDGNVLTFIAAAHPITAMEEAGDSPSGSLAPFNQDDIKDARVWNPQETLNELLQREGIDQHKAWLLHLPFWQVGYTYDEVEYEAWIDAVGGGVFADDLPPTFAKEKDRIYRRAIGVIFLIYLLLGFLVPKGNMAMLAIAVVSFPLYFIVRKLVEEKTA